MKKLIFSTLFLGSFISSAYADWSDFKNLLSQKNFGFSFAPLNSVVHSADYYTPTTAKGSVTPEMCIGGLCGGIIGFSSINNSNVSYYSKAVLTLATAAAGATGLTLCPDNYKLYAGISLGAGALLSVSISSYLQEKAEKEQKAAQKAAQEAAQKAAQKAAQEQELAQEQDIAEIEKRIEESKQQLENLELLKELPFTGTYLGIGEFGDNSSSLLPLSNRGND